MNLLSNIIARLAYIDLANDCKAKDPDIEVPTIDELLENEDVQEFAEECSNKVRDYLRDKYRK